jgi:hypothetical protein
MFMLLTRKGTKVRRLYNVGAATVIAPNRNGGSRLIIAGHRVDVSETLAVITAALRRRGVFAS